MHPRRAFALVLPLLLAGCAAGPAPGDSRQPPAATWDAAAIPPGCDVARPAVAHHAGGSPRTSPIGAIPCASQVGALTFEPTLGASPTTGAIYFFPAIDSTGNLQPEGIAVARSLDQGASWTRLVPGTAGRPAHLIDLDPYFFVDATTGRIFADNLMTLNCSMLSWSDDEGETWSHAPSGCLETDHQTLFAGPPRQGVTVSYPNVVYRCAMNAVALAGGSTMTTCQRSLDGGRSWLPPGEPAFVGVDQANVAYCDGATGHGIVDGNGRVYLPKGVCGEPWLAWSDDEGLTWSRSRVSDLGMHRSPDGYPGHDAGVGVDPDGNVYYFWIAEDRLPRLAISRDGGATWDAPREVQAPGVREATMPGLVVGGVGKVAFLYLGSTNSPGAPFPSSFCDDLVCIGQPPQPPGYERVTWNGYIGATLDALSDDPTFLSASVNDPADPLVRGACGAGSCQGVWDFLDLALAPDGTPWGSFVDTCVEACVASASTQDNAEAAVAGRLWGISLL